MQEDTTWTFKAPSLNVQCTQDNEMWLSSWRITQCAQGVTAPLDQSLYFNIV